MLKNVLTCLCVLAGTMLFVWTSVLFMAQVAEAPLRALGVEP